jgi:hypothetical protein
MIRRSIVPLALILASLALAGCAGTRNVADEPSPKENGEVAEAAPADAALADAAPADTAPDEGVPAETPPPDAPPAETAAAPPPPPAAPAAAPGTFVPTGKPVIVGRVEKVQFPAWVERGGIRAGIKSGWAVYTSDRLTTGPEGRIEIATFGEGRLKMGGDASIEMTQAYEFTGAIEPTLFQVRRGSFQFTAPLRGGANGTTVDIGGAINAVVLGGQIVGRVDSEESLMALVDAVVRVSGPKLNPGTMREANTFLRVPRQGRAQAVSAAGGDRMARWLSQSQAVNGRPTLAGDGQWDVSLNSGYNLRQLEDMACRIQRRGIATEIYPVKEPGKLTWYRVVVRRFATKGDAVNFMNTAKALGSKEPWVLVPQS